MQWAIIADEIVRPNGLEANIFGIMQLNPGVTIRGNHCVARIDIRSCKNVGRTEFGQWKSRQSWKRFFQLADEIGVRLEDGSRFDDRWKESAHCGDIGG